MKTNISLPRLPGDSFSWSRWRRFDLFNLLGIACRTGDIVLRSENLRKIAVGWTEGEQLLCRPKENTIAVMWLYNGSFSWCHLLTDEFIRIFSVRSCNV